MGTWSNLLKSTPKFSLFVEQEWAPGWYCHLDCAMMHAGSMQASQSSSRSSPSSSSLCGLRNDARRIHLGVTVARGRRQRNVTWWRNQDRPRLFVCFFRSTMDHLHLGKAWKTLTTLPGSLRTSWAESGIFWYLKYLPSDNLVSGTCAQKILTI